MIPFLYEPKQLIKQKTSTELFGKSHSQRNFANSRFLLPSVQQKHRASLDLTNRDKDKNTQFTKLALSEIQSNLVFLKLMDIKHIIFKNHTPNIQKKDDNAQISSLPQPLSIQSKPNQIKISSSIWKEIKKQGDSILGRSFHSSCVLNDILYIYGGQNENIGVLDDFYKINLNGKVDKIEINQNIKLKKHRCISYENKIYIFGGQISNTENSSNLYCYDPQINKFELIKYQTKFRSYLKLDSFTIGFYGSKFIVFHGYLNQPQKSRYNSYIFEYDFNTNQIWHKECATLPFTRVNAAYAQNQQNLYIFGGECQSIKLDDLWKYEFETNLWNKIEKQNDMPWPNERSGAAMVYNQNSLILFGGYSRSFMENNDLWIFNIDQSQWKRIDQITTILRTIEQHDKKSPEKGGNTLSISKSQTTLDFQKNHKKQQKKLKEKEEFLKIFESSEKEKCEFNQQEFLIDIKTDITKSDQLGATQTWKDDLIINELSMRPSPRDGSCLQIIGDHLIIFGGDKNKESLNDMYILGIEKLK